MRVRSCMLRAASRAVRVLRSGDVDRGAEGGCSCSSARRSGEGDRYGPAVDRETDGGIPSLGLGLDEREPPDALAAVTAAGLAMDDDDMRCALVKRVGDCERSSAPDPTDTPDARRCVRGSTMRSRSLSDDSLRITPATGDERPDVGDDVRTGDGERWPASDALRCAECDEWWPWPEEWRG